MPANRLTLARLLADNRGLSSTEFGVIIALVALGSLQALTALGGKVESNLDTTAGAVSNNTKYANPLVGGNAVSPPNGGEPAISAGQEAPTSADEPPVASARMAPPKAYDEPAPVQMAPPE